MASEGEFIKIDGDILYASETNNFARKNPFYITGTSIVTAVSGTDFTVMGSILIPAGSMNNPGNLEAFFYSTSTGNNWRVNVDFSGTYGNTSISNDTIYIGGPQIGLVKLTTGSPFVGYILGIFNPSTDETIIGNANNLNLSQNTVVTFKIQTSGGTAGAGSYNMPNYFICANKQGYY